MRIQHKNERYFPLIPNDNELWLLGINDEYCWQHTPGGWTCVLCQCAVTLPAFFAACSLFAKAAVLEARGEG